LYGGEERQPVSNPLESVQRTAATRSAFSLAIHKSTLATPRSPGSPEGRRARERPPCPFGALNGRPERILPWHLGPTRAPRGGRRHAASIWAWRGTPAEHGAAGRRRPPEHRCSCWRSRRGCRDAARPAAGAPPCRDADACCTTEKSRHILSNPARPKARREARGSLAVAAPAAFVCETPFETSDFRKSNRRWERNRRRVDCGMHATAYACIPAGGGWSGGGQPSLSFSRLGRVKAPRKKIVCPTQTPAPGLPPHPSAATRRSPAPDCPVARVRAAGRPQHSRTVLARATSPSLLV